MGLRFKVTLIATVFILSVAGLLAYVSFSGNVYPLTDNLAHAVTIPDQEDMNSYLLAFFEGDEDTKIASAYVRVGQEVDGRYSMMVEIWHDEDTHLDSLSLVFAMQQPLPAMALVAPPSSCWPSLEFHPTADGRSMLLDIPHFGFLGTGTVEFNFLLGLYPPSPDQLTLNISLSLHKTDTSVKLTKLEADGSMEIQL